MRTTITLDDDLFEVAKTLARERSLPIGKIVSDLARRGLTVASSPKKRGRDFPVFAVKTNARPITPEDVKRAAEDS